MAGSPGGTARPGTAVAVSRSGVNDTGAGVFPQSVTAGEVFGTGLGLLVTGFGISKASVASAEALGLERDERIGVEKVEI